MTIYMGNDCSYGCPGCVFDGVLFVLSVSHEMSWMRSVFELSEFLEVFRPSFLCTFVFSGFVILVRYENRK